MLAGLGTFLLTWLIAGLIVYLLSDISYREALIQPGMFAFMFILGWLPVLPVCYDLDEQLS